MSHSTKESLLKIGVVLIVLSGVFPFLLGSVMYIRYQLSYYRPDHPWGALVSLKAVPYSLNDIRNIPDNAINGKNIAVVSNNQILVGENISGFGKAIADDLITITQSGIVNIMNSGVMIILIAIVGVRERQVWALFLLIIIACWTGANSADAILRGQGSLLAVWPVIIGLIGLLLTAPAILPVLTAPLPGEQ